MRAAKLATKFCLYTAQCSPPQTDPCLNRSFLDRGLWWRLTNRDISWGQALAVACKIGILLGELKGTIATNIEEGCSLLIGVSDSVAEKELPSDSSVGDGGEKSESKRDSASKEWEPSLRQCTTWCGNEIWMLRRGGVQWTMKSDVCDALWWWSKSLGAGKGLRPWKGGKKVEKENKCCSQPRSLIRWWAFGELLEFIVDYANYWINSWTWKSFRQPKTIYFVRTPGRNARKQFWT